ncbi:DUF3341 domain-containing protein [Sulfidibacter corallicola]|uniref:DUF3341 domain-containing protein n=1 Tax=Sulfidibacter corallicola TaxID=2818388 RepID=A0A8A4TVL5_SULCO|nr:DUF3341 domain-containing protein [Sulfidibacter corallicola]QTD53979.1 DUF3341 domain-containing protein [Sulfidibacter corallicola]
MSIESTPGVLGIYSHMDTLIDAIKHFKSRGRDDIKVHSPCPHHDLDHALDEPVSPVRRFTLLGGLTGCSFGYLFTSFGSLEWILPTSGKPIVSPVAFTVVAFELTILFGALFTLLGIVLNAKLFTKRKTLYDDRFTDDKFGIFIPCTRSEYEAMTKELTDHGAEEVKHA